MGQSYPRETGSTTPVLAPDHHNRSTVLGRALAAAEARRAVFPVRGKEPAIRRRDGGHGYKDATTDRTRVHALFNKAGRDVTGYGIATGATSGIVVVDVDGPEARREAERLGLTSDYVVRTGRERDGWHLYFSTPPGVKVRSRNLAPDLELKGDGAYVVGPDSLHPEGRRYCVVKDGDPATAPAWIMEPSPNSARPSSPSSPNNAGPVSIDTAGPAILDGERNRELTRIAGRLHDGRRDLDALTRDLLAVNDARCSPPKSHSEVAKIAASIFRCEPCKPTAPEVTPETLAALDRAEAELWRQEWQGMGGKSARDAYVALITLARECGESIPAGVRVAVSVRAWALRTATSKRAMLDYWRRGERKPGIISRLKRAGLIRSDALGRRGGDAGAFVLVVPRAEFHHSPTRGGFRTTESASGETLRAPRLRWGAPEIQRLGKGRGAVVDALEAAGGSMTLEALADALHVKRRRDLRRRTLPPLEQAGVVECSADTVSLTLDWLEALARERDHAGEIAAEDRDRAHYERERDGYRNRHRIKAQRAPSDDELRERRESYPQRRREYIARAIAALFTDRPEYRRRRVGQITCRLPDYLGAEFSRGPDGLPKDREVEALLDGVAA